MILQVTPSWPPEIGGVGDYAYMLESAFIAKGFTSTALVPNFQEMGSALFGVEYGARTLRASIEATDTRTLLLHFSSYGYASRGLCFGLARAVSEWRRADNSRRLVIIFHEVYAFGPPWRSTFWTFLPQQRTARILAKAADKIFSTSAAGEKQINKLGASAEYRPVFSAIGETDTLKALDERCDYAIVFGLLERRRATYAALTESLEAADGLRCLGIKSILDIGPGGDIPATLHGLPVKVCGPLPAREIREKLSEARVGLVDYPMHVITKSSIVAAYFAHGLLVVNTSSSFSDLDDLVEGKHFANPARLLGKDFHAEAIAQEGHRWYCAHDLEKTTDRILTATK